MSARGGAIVALALALVAGCGRPPAVPPLPKQITKAFRAPGLNHIGRCPRIWFFRWPVRSVEVAWLRLMSRRRVLSEPRSSVTMMVLSQHSLYHKRRALRYVGIWTKP